MRAARSDSDRPAARRRRRSSLPKATTPSLTSFAGRAQDSCFQSLTHPPGWRDDMSCPTGPAPTPPCHRTPPPRTTPAKPASTTAHTATVIIALRVNKIRIITPSELIDRNFALADNLMTFFTRPEYLRPKTAFSMRPPSSTGQGFAGFQEIWKHETGRSDLQVEDSTGRCPHDLPCRLAAKPGCICMCRCIRRCAGNSRVSALAPGNTARAFPLLHCSQLGGLARIYHH